MQPSDDHNITDVRFRLESEKSLLGKRLSELTEQDPFSDPDRATDNAASDREASEESVHDRVSALRDELEMKISDIDRALEAISAGTYGICRNCGSEIPEKRLLIMPAATLCVTCEIRKKSRP